ncbi:gag-pol polyprotein [Tanacetum coccineum]
MTTPITTFTTDSQMHNNIMAVGSRDLRSILATGRYAQWQSRFLRYIDTRPNGDALRKCILQGSYTPSTVTILVVPATDDTLAVPERTAGESLNIQDVKTNLFWEFGKFTSHDGESIGSYYSRFYKMMNEMIRNNLAVATMQFNVQFLQHLQPEWSRFVTIVKKKHDLDTISYHKLFDVLKQYQKEVNEIRAKRIAKNANPLALVASTQPHPDPYYQASKSHKLYTTQLKASPLTISHATTRHKGKDIAKPITSPSESASEEDNDPEQAQRDKYMQKNLALIAKYFKNIYKPTNNLRTSSNSRNKNVDTSPRYKNDNQTGQFRNQRTVTVAGAKETIGSHVVQQTGIQCFNCKEFGHFAKECRKPKRVKDFTYHKEKMLLCKQAEKGVPLQAEQSDWLVDTDEEIDEQELEAHYTFMAKIQEVPTADSGTDSEPLEQVQYDVEYNVFAKDRHHSKQPESISNTSVVEQVDNERAALANLIAYLKLDADENKKIQKQLEKANATLTQELTECKSILAETSRTLGESNSIRDSCLIALQNKQTELETYKTLNDLVKEKHDELVKQSLLTKSHYEGLVKEKTKVITDLKLKEEKDIDKMISMEKQLKFLNEIVYKRNQSIQTIHMLAPKGPTFNGRPTFANPMYLKKAQSEKPCLYAIPYDQSDPANRLVPDREETLTLEKESRSKLNKDKVRPYDYTKLNSLYEIFKPATQEYHEQLAHANEVRKKMWRKSFVKSKPKIFKNIGFLPTSKSISKSRQAYNVMTNNINHFRELVDQAWEKHSHDHFRAPTAHDMEILIKTCLMPLALKTQNDSFTFVHELKQEMHANLKYVESFKKEIDELESDKAEFSNMYDILLQECVSNDVMCSYLHSLSDLDAHTELQCLYLHKVKEYSLERKSFSNTKSVPKTHVSEGLSKPVTIQILPQTARQTVRNTNVIKLGMYRIDTWSTQTKAAQLPQTYRNTNPRVSTSTRVIHRTNVSRPQLKSIQMKDKVMPNTSKVKFKKTKVEDHHRISSISNKTKSITACNDSLKSRTSNVNVVCATCGKYVFNLNHDAFVSKFLNDVNARTKKPKVVPISTLCSFGNDQFALILGYGDLVQVNITINRVYYVEGLNHNLFSVGQFCDADLEVAFRKSTCFVRDLHDDYSRYTWTLFLRSKDETPEVLKDFLTMIQRNLQAPIISVRTDRGTEFLNNTLHAFFKEEGIEHQTSTP